MRAIPQLGPPEPGFHPYGSINVGYDSNVFRLDSDAPDIGKRDDQSLTFAAGINGKIPKLLRFCRWIRAKLFAITALRPK